MTKQQFKNLVSRALSLSGMKQAEFARELNISRQYFNDMLRGRKRPEVWQLKFQIYVDRKSGIAHSGVSDRIGVSDGGKKSCLTNAKPTK